MSDLISVIVPAYNMEKYIEQCLESIRLQTYKNIEIIVIDDGSTDSTGIICDKFAQRDSRFRIIHQENLGLVRTRKKGISLAKGNYIGFVDSDDWIDKDMYEYLYQNMKETQAQIVTSGRYLEEGKNSYIILDYIPHGVYYPLESKFFCRHMIFGEEKKIWGITPNFWNKLFEKQILINYEKLVDDRITYGEDDACVYPCMAFANIVSVTNRSFYHYRIRKTSMSNSLDENYFFRINLLYLCLKRSFEKHPLADILKKELDLYMFEFVWRGLHGLWGIDPGIKIPHMLMDMSCLIEERKIILYGAARAGQDYYQQLKLANVQDKIVWVDKAYKKYQQLGFPVQPINAIDKENCDLVIVAVIKQETFESIKQDLLNIGINEKNIYWSKPRDILSCAD